MRLLLSLIATVITSLLIATSCQDDLSSIGNSLATGEVIITVDTLTFDIKATPIEVNEFDSKTGTLLLGNLNVEAYGSLECSFVTRLMCSPNLNVPDSLFSPERVDSCKLLMQITRGNLVGDSVAPQQLTVYPLIKQLPSDITNAFDPQGYYDIENPLGKKSFTLSNIALGDTAYYKSTYVPIDVDLPLELGKEIFKKYIEEPDIFQWPQTFAQYFPGIYVKHTFGNGCVGNIDAAFVAVYYHEKAVKTTITDTDTVRTTYNRADSVIPFVVSPEVLSSNNIKYRVSDKIRNMIAEGNTVITTPGGYQASFNLPIQELLEIYNSRDSHLATVNDLLISIPAKPLDNDLGIKTAPTLMLIKTSEVENFFAKNKIPDGEIAFTGLYNSDDQVYKFASMRSYFINLLNKETISEEDTNFTIIPVDLTTENVSNGYYTTTTTTYVTKCVPYTVKPTVTILNMDETQIVFSFSTQLID